MYVSVHIYKHLALFFFCCCKVFSPLFILTLLDHVVLVSSASTTNTREIKNRFRLERWTVPCAIVLRKNPEGRHQTPQKLSKRNQKIVFFLWIFFLCLYDILFMIFFFTIFCLLSSFCFDKYTKNYYYIHTVFLRFLCFCFAIVCVVFQYIFFFVFLRGPRSIDAGSRATNSGIWISLPLS